MSFDWNPFAGGGDFVKFERIGDEAVGKIIAIRTHTSEKFKDKGPQPVVDLEPLNGGDTVTVAIDKVDLKEKVIPLSPQVGDMLAIKYVDTEATGNGTKKVFAVKHKVGDRPADTDPFDGATKPEVEYDETPF